MSGGTAACRLRPQGADRRRAERAPLVLQAARTLRYRVDVAGGRCARESVYAITGLSSAEVSPVADRPPHPTAVDHHFTVSATPALPRPPQRSPPTTGRPTWATLGNPEINALRVVGHRNIAASLREVSCEPSTRLPQAPGHQLTCVEV